MAWLRFSNARSTAYRSAIVRRSSELISTSETSTRPVFRKHAGGARLSTQRLPRVTGVGPMSKTPLYTINSTIGGNRTAGRRTAFDRSVGARIGEPDRAVKVREPSRAHPRDPRPAASGLAEYLWTFHATRWPPTRPEPEDRSMSARYLILLLVMLASLADHPAIHAAEPIDVGSRLQLLADSSLIDRLSPGARLVLHRPEPREVSVVMDRPWEGNAVNYVTAFQDGEIFRLYYRGADVQYSKDGYQRESSRGELLCREP